MDVGSSFERFIAPVRPTMWEASVTTSPLKPSLPRSRSVMSSLLSVAGRISSAAMSGLSSMARSKLESASAGRPSSISILARVL